MKYLGIDYGQSKVGLALGDSETGLALPYKIIGNPGWKGLVADLLDIVKSENIETLVVGLPLNTRSEASNQTEQTRKFAEELKTSSGLTLELFDERFSSQEAKKLGAGKRDDDIAAMLVLQNYLDSNPISD
jgi:putative Holliday junction resolvase